MSTINEALKKAQKERDANHLPFGSILSLPGRRNPLLKKKYLFWLIVLVMLIIGTLAAETRLGTKNTPLPGVNEEEIKPLLLIEPSPSGNIESDRLYDRAMDFHGKGQLRLARRFYLEVLRIDPGNINTINNLGVICLAEKNFEEAEDHFSRAIDLNAGSVDPYYNLACLYALKGDNRRGLDNLKKAIQMDQTAREWAKKDRDLDGLRAEPEFDFLVNDHASKGLRH